MHFELSPRYPWTSLTPRYHPLINQLGVTSHSPRDHEGGWNQTTPDLKPRVRMILQNRTG